MQPAASVSEYLVHPFGSYVAGRTYLHFFAERDLCGTLLWGCTDAVEANGLVRAIGVELPEHSPPHRAYVDARGITSIDEGAFETLVAYVGPRAKVLGANVARQALVRPSGVRGAVVAGFYNVAPAAHPERTRIFDDPVKAMQWLGLDAPGALLAELEDARAAASGMPSLIRSVHDFVAAHPRQVTVREIARVNGVSPRTLQHQLRALGTSFRREVNAARIRVAQQLLQRGEAKLTSVAMEVGCSSLQHFSNLFRKLTGQTPSDWRARHRGAS